jgi:hypothetical protein
LGAGSTFESKKRFEKWSQQSYGIKTRETMPASAYSTHKSSAYVMDQEIDFLDTGAHQQDGVAEQGIGIVTQRA